MWLSSASAITITTPAVPRVRSQAPAYQRAPTQHQGLPPASGILDKSDNLLGFLRKPQGPAGLWGGGTTPRHLPLCHSLWALIPPRWQAKDHLEPRILIFMLLKSAWSRLASRTLSLFCNTIFLRCLLWYKSPETLNLLSETPLPNITHPERGLLLFFKQGMGFQEVVIFCWQPSELPPYIPKEKL